VQIFSGYTCTHAGETTCQPLAHSGFYLSGPGFTELPPYTAQNHPLTDANGRFQALVPIGEYGVTGLFGAHFRCNGPTSVTVNAGSTASVTQWCFWIG